jgi:hypothetical protein
MADHVDLIKADALERAARTLWQGIGIDALVTIGAGTLVLVQDGNILSPALWGTIGALVVKSFTMSAASYLARLKVAPTAS